MATTRSRDGVEIAFRTEGQGQQTLLFMHGWAGSGAYFDELLPHLDLSRLRAVTFDYRGHGDSAPGEAYGLGELAADALAVADAAGAGRFVSVGYSMSGKFAQYVSVLHAERVSGQILVAGCPTGELPLPAEMVADWYSRAGDVERMIELALPFMSCPVAGDVLQRFGRDAARAPLAALKGTMEAVTTTSFEPAQVPTLVVGGRNDPMFSPEALRDGVAAPVRGARLELLDCGHEIPIELPAKLAALIEGFVAGLS